MTKRQCYLIKTTRLVTSSASVKPSRLSRQLKFDIKSGSNSSLAHTLSGKRQIISIAAGTDKNIENFCNSTLTYFTFKMSSYCALIRSIIEIDSDVTEYVSSSLSSINHFCMFCSYQQQVLVMICRNKSVRNLCLWSRVTSAISGRVFKSSCWFFFFPDAIFKHQLTSKPAPDLVK